MLPPSQDHSCKSDGDSIRVPVMDPTISTAQLGSSNLATAPTKLERFELFPKLPAEIRIKIWKATIGPRKVFCGLYTSEENLKNDARQLFTWFIATGNPPAMDSCIEARTELLPYYNSYLELGSRLSCYREWVVGLRSGQQPHSSWSRVRFDPDRDILAQDLTILIHREDTSRDIARPRTYLCVSSRGDNAPVCAGMISGVCLDEWDVAICPIIDLEGHTMFPITPDDLRLDFLKHVFIDIRVEEAQSELGPSFEPWGVVGSHAAHELEVLFDLGRRCYRTVTFKVHLEGRSYMIRLVTVGRLGKWETKYKHGNVPKPMLWGDIHNKEDAVSKLRDDGAIMARTAKQCLFLVVDPTSAEDRDLEVRCSDMLVSMASRTPSSDDGIRQNCISFVEQVIQTRAADPHSRPVVSMLHGICGKNYGLDESHYRQFDWE
ncbi:hypothetical protein QBC42DRAFT_292942 [Cladorrhinum samala]|uniref:2EXR domain-containing protein n=1 Tax=Cladorrhinum samala TaxID=585594 RepID=A0AAV9I5H1_9PEZI|nr:hypothetical protein QBC42DRAFT_292942 [Cladorrhinum samala]